jgi:hypothetical protein
LRVTASRLDGGKPLREAMKAQGYNRITLSARTQEVDELFVGVSQQLIAFLATDRKWGRDTCTVQTAVLIAKALGKREADLFDMPPSFTPTVSTHN